MNYDFTQAELDELKRRVSALPAFVRHVLLNDVVNQTPIPMLLTCPLCGTRHIDEGEFKSKAHHTHACQGFVFDEVLNCRRRCGHVWRPALVFTVGVEAIPGFVNEEPPPPRHVVAHVWPATETIGSRVRVEPPLLEARPGDWLRVELGGDQGAMLHEIVHCDRRGDLAILELASGAEVLTDTVVALEKNR